MAEIDVGSQRRSLLGDATALAQLPPELLHIIRGQAPANFLDAVARAALMPRLTGRIFAHFEAVFADVCSRWAASAPKGVRDDEVVAAFARILPFAPYLSIFLDRYLQESTPRSETETEAKPQQREVALLDFSAPPTGGQDGLLLLPRLLAAWRLVSFDKNTYSPLILPSHVQGLFRHADAAVRYLAIRLFCQLLDASDLKLESLIRQHVPSEAGPLTGDFDGQDIDYTFLTLVERQRAEDVYNLCLKLRESQQGLAKMPPYVQTLTPLAVRYGNVVLPRQSASVINASSLVRTSTTLENLEGFAKRLQKPGPILLHGLAGAGKTSLVQEAARELGMAPGLVTLHLNEQTDAKMLIGLYTTDVKPGTFVWRPGILTTAVKEGRWVLIEDLDRAPTEVMSTLLPLIERGELLIPNRGERIRAPSSFRIIATVRTSLGVNGQENLPSLLGLRFWQLFAVRPLPQAELQQIIEKSHPRLEMFVPEITRVFEGACALFRHPGSLQGATSSAERPISPRDLFKWCRRLDRILRSTESKAGRATVSQTTLDWMFMEALDCFTGGIKDANLRVALVVRIGELMGRSKERVLHHLESHIPVLQEDEHRIAVGRVTLRKARRQNRVAKSRRPFATTTHARRLLEQIATAVELKEPVLLVGETGIGKTTVVQQLADSLGHKLVAVNLSQQSEVGDLLGGFKPVNVRSLAVPLKEEFEDLFASTGISAERNQKYLDRISRNVARGKWTDVAKLWRQAPKMFDEILRNLESQAKEKSRGDGQPAKRRKTESSRLQTLRDLKPRWELFTRNLEQFEIQVSGGSNAFAFSFVEGNIVKAARNGDWVLLDEINLASPDTLESIADLLQSGPDATPSILLSETGEIERIQAHPEFRIFGAMNPATDVGKRDLPLGIRSRFTELYVSSPDRDVKDLVVIIKSYLKGNSSALDQGADKVASVYLQIKALAEAKALVDGANEVPHFSLRTLTRVLTYVNDVAPFYGLDRALYEGFCMGFLTLLSRDSEQRVMPLILDGLLGKNATRRQALLSQPARHPSDGRQYTRFMNQDKDRQYWLVKGEETPLERTDYIRTQSVERNLLNLVRATSTRRFPILIQGPTSAGKTSMIEYLANYSGNRFVRINNHEHTDLQEYLGTYVSGADGKLKFQEGLLVQALRQGYWIVLDELNLAPTDVLEALNRLLDDNRELLIPETQEIVKPHDNFMLFATQNPPGLYGGRKALSRAFRNRFLELHFDDIPEDELEYILQKRSINTAPSDCRRIVSVYKELSRLRQTSRVFEQKDSFATLRDLFRWALRNADTREEIANNGFMLLAERVRNEEERLAVKGVIETVFKLKISPEALYSSEALRSLGSTSLQNNSQGVVWTNAMRRLYVLVAQAIRNNEPVLLVGETGCGKTTVCQILAEALRRDLHIVNAHQNTETGDLIGSQRPVRNRGAIVEALKSDLAQVLGNLGVTTDGTVDDLLRKYHELPSDVLAQAPAAVKGRIEANQIRSKALFEWSDGSLVHAMKSGQFFLLDEISLADDSVLERLNSVLEPQRTLLLAEKGVDNSFVQAADGFQFFATMNPGGDFGKKELSPALRNRFTEIWVPPLTESQDILDIVADKLKEPYQAMSRVIVDFSYWFGQAFRSSAATAFSIRDILVWVKFINQSGSMPPELALMHGAATVFIDTLGANPSALLAIDPRTMQEQRQKCLDKLNELIGQGVDVKPAYQNEPALSLDNEKFTIGDFSIARSAVEDNDAGFAFDAPTTKMNAMRVVRALRVEKPILLEGNPGVGKTTLVSALARACGMPLTRINLSDQTDLMDLFGTDVPVEGEEAGNFAWRDAPFLQAMQKGEWVLLDEMNLASQSVLEGLNACLDHRGEVYISELDQVFKRHPDFRLFAAQNPHHQGGGRKGLPSSFVNRFVVVYADVFTEQDLMLIAGRRFQNISPDVIKQMITFISSLDYEVVVKRSFGSHGSPWEFNLRDTLRWLELLASKDPLLASATASDFLDIIIRQRFRTLTDRHKVDQLFRDAFQAEPKAHSLYHNLGSVTSQVGLAMLSRNALSQPTPFPAIDIVPRLAEIESLMLCIKLNLPCILVGPSGSGKSALLQQVAASTGHELVIFPMNADIDTMDLVGGFEQSDPLRDLQDCLGQVQQALRAFVLSCLPKEAPTAAMLLLGLLNEGHGAESFDAIARHMQSLVAAIPVSSTLRGLVARALHLLQQPLVMANPRFEWLDGIIVQAMELGQWLVLDNANLCSASVLDRLNSLLERPDGFLSINEHSGSNGEPRVVRPHANFRIFLTMDPRYGELSRAMRNRSIEIHLESAVSNMVPYLPRIAAVESSMQRYHDMTSLFKASDNSDVSTAVFPDILSLEDSAKLQGYAQVLTTGVVRVSEQDSSHSLKSLSHVQSYIQSQEAMAVRQALLRYYESLSAPVLVTTTSQNVEVPSLSEDSFSSLLVRSHPLHPLQNPLLAKLVEQSPWVALGLGYCYDFFLETRSIQETVQAQLRTIDRTRPSSLNRFQRAVISDQVATVAKDSTVKVSGFLASVANSMETYIETSAASPWVLKDGRSVLRALLHYWNRTFRSVTASTFDEARFQAHLQQGLAFLRMASSSISDDATMQVVASTLTRLQQDFVTGFQLATGLSMETLWNIFRPSPISNEATLVGIQEMEHLARRFDSLRWRANASVADLGKAMASLTQAYSVIRTTTVDTNELINALKAEIESLESTTDETRFLPPFLAEQFEILREAQVLHNLSKSTGPDPDSQDVAVLSDVPTISQMRTGSWSSTSSILASMDYLLAKGSSVHPWSNLMSATLLSKFDSLRFASLSTLRSLEVELPTMAKRLALSSTAITASPVHSLNSLLFRLLQDVVSAHDPSLVGEIKTMFDILQSSLTVSSLRITEQGIAVEIPGLQAVQQADCSTHLRQIVDQHFVQVIIALVASEKSDEARSAFSSIAWVQFAVGCIKLYVPDKTFDPYLRAQTEREFHEELYAQLQEKLSALRALDRAFTGQDWSMRSELLSEEIEQLGAPPPAAQVIYRPSSAELSAVQREFVNVLNAVVKHDVSSMHFRYIISPASQEAQELQLVNSNIAQLIERLASRFHAYQDVTLPLVSLLRCLQVGLSLSDSVAKAASSGESLSLALLGVTPFLGGTAWRSEPRLPSRNIEFLSFVSLVVSVEGISALSESMRRRLFESVHFFYDEWSKKLEADQKNEAANTSLYRFKGSLEDEEEFDQNEFLELFPDYEADEQAPKQASARHDAVRNLSVKLAALHEKIFLEPENRQAALRDMCKLVARKLAKETPSTSINLDQALLPAAMLVLEEKLSGFNTESKPTTYNFYNDAHLSEARKLVNLVNGIQLRFRELQSIDEIAHMQPLADVLVACEDVLELSHTEPLAKIIVRVEKLHQFVYEWQFGGWASRANTALPLYNRLTEMIVTWRRLELSTWGKLFDMEIANCDKDAKSWWFVAYQAVIAIPMAKMELDQNLGDYAIQLVLDLELFFARATIGQFKTRLHLLRQLEKHLELLVLDYPPLAAIQNAVRNFISLYRRYEVKVVEAIQKGRASIDKSMKDVLLVASWKDTNIAALRESSRRSHLKLFRIVRKFRELLGQPLKPIIDQGLPDQEHAAGKATGTGVLPGPRPMEDKDAAALCQRLIPGWGEDAHTKRLANADRIVSVMDKASRLPESSIQAAEEVDSFVSDLMETMADLRKETPSFLTEENKQLVQHLKSRKVRLYEETLKTIRRMGFSRNLSENLLRIQSSIGYVFARVNPLRSVGQLDFTAAEYYFHKVLDLAPRFRATLHDHSGDLNREVVRRSAGYLEGMLHVLTKQRSRLSEAASAISSLDTAIRDAKVITMTDRKDEVDVLRQPANHLQVVQWLVQILRFGSHLVQVHAKLGKISDDGVQARLLKWAGVFEPLEEQLREAQDIPAGFTSLKEAKTRERVSQELQAMTADLQFLEEERPDLAFVTQQILLWNALAAPSESSIGAVDNSRFLETVMDLSKKLLDAIQKYQKAVSEMPTSTEDASWLMKYDDSASGGLVSLRMDTVASDVNVCINLLKSVDFQNPSAKKSAFALLAVVLPLLQQYANTCHGAVFNFAQLHRATGEMAYNLSRSFTQIASQGFCTPQEKSDEKSGETGKMEGGTGLGDGEGADDISKDIQPDEDLSELAQEANNEAKDEIEDEKDAVDMGGEEMEGEMGSVDGQDEEEEDSKSGDEKEEEDEMDEEAGDVDDLDPTAVDEKMWDGDGEEADKEQQGEKPRGQKNEDEQVAADDAADQKGEPEEKGDQAEPEFEEEMGPEQEDAAPPDDLNKQDQNVEENEALALPEDMDIDANDQDSASSEGGDDLDDLSEGEAQPDEDKKERDVESVGDADEKEETKPQEIAEEVADSEGGEEEDPEGEVDAEMELGDQEEPEQPEQPHEDEDKMKPPPVDDTDYEQQNAVPSEVQGGGGQDENDVEEQNEEESENKAAQRENGRLGQNADDQETAGGQEGALSRSEEEQTGQDENRQQDPSESQPFKKLGDALERWYRNHQDIKEAMDSQDDPQKQDKAEAEMAKQEFQHVQDDETAPDAQALGTATEEEVRPIDDNMAVDEDMEGDNTHILPEEMDMEDAPQDQEAEAPEKPEPQDKDGSEQDEGRTGVATRRGAYEKERSPSPADSPMVRPEDEAVQETSTQLSVTHLADEDRPLRDYSECLRLWTTFQSKTHPLSLALTSQLRLILTPSQSTKLSGSYRTGKRLNIKKIIPYIASSYKRDKIWMRRAVPTKRSYQILLCVDDSRSMGETTSGNLALESLVMVSRALSMLEAGQVGVMGFGADVFTAHELTEPFASHDAGAKVLQRFSFEQDRTDISLLIRRTIDQFRLARLQGGAGRGSEDLWQLALILSDGLTPSSAHERIRRLLREAMEERIMVVFIIMDESGKTKGDSVLELKEARFVKDEHGSSSVVIERYLDTFPFQYYLIVHNLEDLPGALAGLLRTWFAEVNQ